MHTMHVGGNCSLSESECNESDEEVWNEDFDTDLENGSDICDIPEIIQADNTPQTNCFGKVVTYLYYIPSINISSLRQRF